MPKSNWSALLLTALGDGPALWAAPKGAEALESDGGTGSPGLGPSGAPTAAGVPVPHREDGSSRRKPFRLQAIITINIDASDDDDVAAHKRRLAEQLEILQAQYVAARLDIKARRPRCSPRAGAPAKLGKDFEVVRALYVG